MTRVLVVDDSAFIRTVVDDALTDAGYTVETAVTGEAAIELVGEFDPDVITMDVEMPGMGGIEAVERIMSTNPTAILMLSAQTAAGAKATMDALERGAVDVVQKPDGSDDRSLTHLVEDVRETVAELSDANVSTLALARAAAAVHATSSAGRSSSGSAGGSSASAERSTAEGGSSPVTVDDAAPLCDDPTIVIGASTGGPRIVERILERLPAELGANGVIVQHMPAAFTGRFADRLDAVSEYSVREARDGDRVAAGELVVAPGDAHLEIASNVAGRLRVRIGDDEPIHGVTPAIDVTMESAAERVTDPLAAVVLTGMGRDGSAGIEAVAAAGGRTIAQDEASSPIYGMPKHAVETGCVDDVVAAERIPDLLVEAFDERTNASGDLESGDTEPDDLESDGPGDLEPDGSGESVVNGSDGPALNSSDGPALNSSDGPALNGSDGPALNGSDGPALNGSDDPEPEGSGDPELVWSAGGEAGG